MKEMWTDWEMMSTVVRVCGNPDANLNVLLVNKYRKPQEITQGCVEVFGRDGLELRPLMDLWIMGLLYKLIVRGSRLHGAFAEKGLVRSVYPTGRMHGRSPVLSLSVWRTVCLGWRRQTRGGMGDGTEMWRQRKNEYKPWWYFCSTAGQTQKPERAADFEQKPDENSSSWDLSWI